ncbi:hypothetical protein Dimus_012133 [Dionaea muscipula]
MIPTKYLLKMAVHTINWIDVFGYGYGSIKVSVADRADVIDWHVNDMRNIVARSSPPVVGLDLKAGGTSSLYQILVLYVNDRCLVVQLEHLDKFPESLISFLTDPNFCHVGIAINKGNCEKLKRERFKPSPNLTNAGVDVGELAARVRGKSCLLKSTLAELAQEAGLRMASPQDSKDGTKAAINVGARFFSSEEVKIIVKDAFSYYKIGHKLLSSL